MKKKERSHPFSTSPSEEDTSCLDLIGLNGNQLSLLLLQSDGLKLSRIDTKTTKQILTKGFLLVVVVYLTASRTHLHFLSLLSCFQYLIRKKPLDISQPVAAAVKFFTTELISQTCTRCTHTQQNVLSISVDVMES